METFQRSKRKTFTGLDPDKILRVLQRSTKRKNYVEILPEKIDKNNIEYTYCRFSPKRIMLSNDIFSI